MDRFERYQQHAESATLVNVDLHPTCVDELHASPSALDFLRYVGKNQPFVVRNNPLDSRASQLWSPSYLCQQMGERPLSIACSPSGNADALFDGMFVQPAELQMTMREFLRRLKDRHEDEVCR